MVVLGDRHRNDGRNAGRGDKGAQMSLDQILLYIVAVSMVVVFIAVCAVIVIGMGKLVYQIWKA